MKAEIMLRLGLKAPLTFDKVSFNRFVSFYTSNNFCQMVTSPNKDVTSRLKGVSEQTHATSINTIDSRLMVRSWPVFPTRGSFVSSCQSCRRSRRRRSL